MGLETIRCLVVVVVWCDVAMARAQDTSQAHFFV